MSQMLYRFRIQILALGWSLFSICVHAQGWQRFVGGSGEQRAFAVHLTVDGGIVAAGSTNDSVGDRTDWFLLRTDAFGQVGLQKRWGDADSSEYAADVLQNDDQIFLLGNTTFSFASPNGAIEYGKIIWQNLDNQGNILFEGHDDSNALAHNGMAWETGHLITGARYVQGQDFFYPEPYGIFLDSAGAVLWTTVFPNVATGEAMHALTLADHTALVAVKAYADTTGSDIALYKVDPSGNMVAEKHWLFPGNERPEVLLPAGTGSVVLVGDRGNTPATTDIFLAKVDNSAFDTLWFRQILLPGAQTVHAAVALSNGDIAIAGEQIPEGATSRDAFLALVDANGHLRWIKTYGGLKGDIFWDIQAAVDGNGFVIAGQTASFSPGADLQAWLVRTDSTGKVWRSEIVGQVVRDAVQNCVVDPSEAPLPHWLVTASGSSGTLYALTDALGHYALEADTGTWYVSSLPPDGYWMPCEDSIQLNINILDDTLTVDFLTQVLYECPLLFVDLTTPFLRRCFENTYQVRYFNYGTSTAPDAVVSIVLDPFLSMTGASLPFTQSGDTLYFSVGPVPWLSGGNFTFSAVLACDTAVVLGQTHCTEAHIYPDSLCYHFNPDWDGSNLEVDGHCAGDSVLLTVTNTGLGMQGAVNFIITEDQIIFRQSSLQLGENQDTTFVLYPNGATVAIVVTQTPGHPGSSQPMLVVEGCGAGAFSTGYAFQFPQNDGDLAVDIECRQNIGAFDPNDKTGLPLGVSDQGVIESNTAIEYLIRFQNTGTDTAFRVEIRDTLSKFLDLSTLKEGASSHPHRLSLSGSGALSFVFDPIALPDSSANWLGSQGFVKYSIAPKPGIAPGSIITNAAAIYFDHNAPVVTNTTKHTIDHPIPYLNTKTLVPGGHAACTNKLVVFPNPAREQILVTLPQPSKSGGLQVEILDVLGLRQKSGLQWLNPETTPLFIDLGTLPSGLYFILAKDENGNTLARTPITKI